MDPRGELLQIIVTKGDLLALDSRRFGRRMPSRAAAVRELQRRGLSAEGLTVSDGGTTSGDFGVTAERDAKSRSSQDHVPEKQDRHAGK